MPTNVPLIKYICAVVEVGRSKFEVSKPVSVRKWPEYCGMPYVKVAGGNQFTTLREFHEDVCSVVRSLEQAGGQPVTLDIIADRLSEHSYSCDVYGLYAEPMPKPK